MGSLFTFNEFYSEGSIHLSSLYFLEYRLVTLLGLYRIHVVGGHFKK